jgi:SAM-dependent methyltransferase
MKRIEHVDALRGYELWAETYDDTPNPVVVLDSRHSLRVLTPAAGELVLDAGCGTGRNLGGMLAEGARPVGLDFSAAMLGVAHRRYPDVPLAVADLQRPLPFRDAVFDAALCALVGEHLEDLPVTFAELHRVLKPGGRLLFSVYHPDLAESGAEANFERDGVEYRLGAIDYSVDEYLTFIAQAGFAEMAFRSFSGDAQLAQQISGAEKYLGTPVLLVVAAIN